MKERTPSDISVVEAHYFPPVSVFGLMHQWDVLLEYHETYQKRTFRNKCMIANAQGVQILTIPLKKGKHESQAITDVKISYDEPWQARHLAAIRTAYGSAAFFEEYIEEITKMVCNHESNLLAFTTSTIQEICELLDVRCFIGTTSSYLSTDHYHADFRDRITPRSDEIDLPDYAQVFGENYSFVSNLSILDLLFCMGPSSKLYLSSLPGLSRIIL
ncbi:MAG: WbqC family protein [Saprospiraceae bacterium]|nr:WbqC family protein [Saprospiraceae bacterium]